MAAELDRREGGLDNRRGGRAAWLGVLAEYRTDAPWLGRQIMVGRDPQPEKLNIRGVSAADSRNTLDTLLT